MKAFSDGIKVHYGIETFSNMIEPFSGGIETFSDMIEAFGGGIETFSDAIEVHDGRETYRDATKNIKCWDSSRQ